MPVYGLPRVYFVQARMGCQRLFWTSFGPILGLPGPLLDLSGAVWVSPWPLFGSPGALLAHSWDFPGLSWDSLELSGSLCGLFLDLLGLSEHLPHCFHPLMSYLLWARMGSSRLSWRIHHCFHPLLSYFLWGRRRVHGRLALKHRGRMGEVDREIFSRDESSDN